MKGIFGATRVSRGQLTLDGQRLDIRSPIDAIRAGIMLCPEDRKADGIIPVHSVRDNINISARRKSIRAGCLINNGWEVSNADHHIRALNIKTPSAGQLIMNLSGGNQQKAILGRWLSEEMKVILLDEPTRGIDVGAKHEIYHVIYQLAQQGIAVLFASSDLPEVLGLADRIIVMREGAISGELLHDDASEEKALSLAMLRTPILPLMPLWRWLDCEGERDVDHNDPFCEKPQRPGAGAYLGQLRHAGGVRGAVYRLRSVCA
ncbi:Arabinose import ATP-binding protein AraG [Serratia plymuthica]|uniref:Arabinose import ATP-binding protein AraG n=1 Tax=Serratia plymuthica TaxID=82996 RepID=A0A2X4XR82_SERPL|nr:Arabinose import ATP-binding protein AraG [Serratia plymuthica]